MGGGVFLALFRKDLLLLFRNPTVTVVPTVFLALFIVLYFFLPSTVDEELIFATHGSPLPPAFVAELAEEDGVRLTELERVEELRQGVEDGDYMMGIVFPPDLLTRIAAGERPVVEAVFAPGVLPEMKTAGAGLVEQMVFMLQGTPLEVVHDESAVLGPDMTGKQIPTRDRLLPIIALFIILVEVMGLAILIVDEFQAGTVTALRATGTPMSAFLSAKALTGISLAFLQAVLLLAITGAITAGPLLLLTGLLLGSLLVCGLGFLIAAPSNSMMTVFAWGSLAMLVLFLPGLNTIFPGMMTGWVKIIPSHYLADLMHRVVHFDASWSQLWGHLLILLGFDLGFLALGTLALKRRLS
jgi:ABC-2 type transport system permease protein